MIKIHPSAIVDPKAEISEGVEIGPYAIIGPDVRIGERTFVDTHAVIRGCTEIGTDNQIGVGAVIGLEPQDISYRGEKSFVKIGNFNKIREYVQIHRGSKEGSATLLEDHNFILGFSHVAHNCKLGSRIILANGVLLAGHVELEDYVFLSGHCIVHQFCKVGSSVMMRGNSRVSLDIPPYCIADDTNTVRGINTIGLERRGFSTDTIRKVKKVYKELFNSAKPLKELVENLLAEETSAEVRHFLEFIKDSERGICRPKA